MWLKILAFACVAGPYLDSVNFEFQNAIVTLGNGTRVGDVLRQRFSFLVEPVSNAAHSRLRRSPPLAYFRKRQLMQSRSILLNSAPERGAVRRGALDVGLTELGRFSVEYHHLFGESPSATLGQSPGRSAPNGLRATVAAPLVHTASLPHFSPSPTRWVEEHNKVHPIQLYSWAKLGHTHIAHGQEACRALPRAAAQE